MSFPYIFESTFEDGTVSEWDSETDTASQLDIAHYSELARWNYTNSTPFSGAFAMRLALTGGTADAFLEEGDVNVALAGTFAIRFPIWFSDDFTATADDTFVVMELQGAADAVQVALGFRVVAATNVINIGAGVATPTSFAPLEIERGKHYIVEITGTLDSGVGNDGTINVFVTREDQVQNPVVIALTALDQIAVTHAVLGLQDHLATTTGRYYISHFIADDARLGAVTRFPQTIVSTKSEHAFIGRGCIAAAALASENANNILRLWDTDEADTSIDDGWVAELGVGAQSSISDDFQFDNGCFVELIGTDPKAEILLLRATDKAGKTGPLHYSISGYRENGLSR